MGLLFNRGGCNAHHFGDGTERIEEATVSRSDVLLRNTTVSWSEVLLGNGVPEVLELKVPIVAECQHEGCYATKTKRVRKQYVLLEDICKNLLELEERIESE